MAEEGGEPACSAWITETALNEAADQERLLPIKGVVLVERSADFIVFIRIGNSEVWRFVSLRRPGGTVKRWTDYWKIRGRLARWGYRGVVCSHEEGDPGLAQLRIALP